METWKTCIYQGKKIENYEVSNLGNVRNANTKYILKQAEHKGYMQVSLYIKNVHITARVHKLVAETFLINNDLEVYTDVNHIDGIKTNNCLSNLEWTTHKENIQHARKTGLFPTTIPRERGTKLTKEDVNYIRNNWKTIKKEDYGITQGYLNRVLRNEHWYDENYIPPKEVLEKHKEEKQIQKERKLNIPPKEVLESDLKTIKNFVEVGKKYGVVDNTVRKWCKKYNLPYKTSDYKPKQPPKPKREPKLSSEDILYIKENYKSGDKEFGARALGRKFNVAHSTIERIGNNKYYKDLKR